MSVFSKLKKFCCVFIAIAMLLTMTDIPGLGYNSIAYGEGTEQIEDSGTESSPDGDDIIPDDDYIPDDDDYIPDDDDYIPDVDPEDPEDDIIKPGDDIVNPDDGDDPSEGGDDEGGDDEGDVNPPAPEVEDWVNVDSADALETAINDGNVKIRITADFNVDRTFYIDDNICIYTDEAHTLTRDPSFDGDFFVVGENELGESVAERVTLTLGKPDSTANDLLIIDGNESKMSVDVNGSVVFVCGKGQADLRHNLTVTNCKKVGNVRAADSKHGMSNTEYIGGAVAIASANSILNIYGGKYTNNSVNTSGSSIYGGAFYNFSEVHVYGGLFENNSAVRAGVFYNYRTLHIYNATIRNNTASTLGGAIYSPASTGAFLYIGEDNEIVNSSVTFSGNKATSGGAISSSGRIFAKNAVFEENKATEEYGGAVFGTGNYNVMEFENTDFINNSSVYGGAIGSRTKTTLNYNWGLKAKNVRFIGNSSSKSGGSIYLITGVRAFLERCDFEGSSATANGGVFFISAAELEADKCTFTDNKGYHGSVMITEENAIVTLNGVVATGNVATKNGTINATNTTLNVYNGTFNNNTASVGSGIYMGTGATGGIYKTSFDSNTCYDTNTSYSSALYLYNGGSDVTVHSCKFTNNTSSGLGGAIVVANKTQAKLYNITAINNSAAKGGALYITAAGTVAQLSGLTVSGNTAKTGGPIIWGNTANAKLNVDKSKHKDLDVSGPYDSDYWKDAVANALTVKDVSLEIPTYTDYSKEDMGTLWDSVDVKSFDELKAALTGDEKFIRVAADITLNDTLFVTEEKVIFTTDDYKLIRDKSFTGNMFVVGQKEDGSLCDSTVKLVLGNTDSQTPDLLLIDGNGVHVPGSAVYVTKKGQVDVCTNVTFTNNRNNSQANGAAITVAADAAVNVNGGKFTNNTGVNGGAVYNLGALNVNAGTFESNTATNGATVYNASTMNAVSGTFSKNSATNGAAVYNTGILTVKGVQFTENTAENGGAIYGQEGTIDINANTYSANVASENGGAVYVLGGTITSFDVSLSENKAKTGGGIYISDAEGINCTLTSTTFTANSADNAGAAYIACDNADISSSTFKNNTSKGNGGAVVLENCMDTTLIGITANGNKATGNGGFLYTQQAGFTLKDSSILNSKAENGGAVAVNGGINTRVNNNNFEGNVAYADGGAIYSCGDNKDLIVVGGTFKENNAAYGGAVALDKSVLELSGSEFTENIADLNGGVFSFKNAENIVVFDITADANTADNNGGLVYAAAADFKIYNSSVKNSLAGLDGGAVALDNGAKSGIYGTSFEGNSADRYGGVVYAAAKGTENMMHTCSFTDNTSANNGGVAYVAKGSIWNLYNSEFSANSGKTTNGIYITDAGTTVTLIGLEVDSQKAPLVWGANASAVLNINKTEFKDTSVSGTLGKDYWSKAIANKLTVNDITEKAPLYQEYGEEFAGGMSDAFSVSSAQELENAINAGKKHIRVISDFEIDRTFYITSDVTIFTTAPKTLKRAADFGGDIFVVGQTSDGKNSMIEKADAKLTLGNPSSATENLLTIDGNKENMSIPVFGTVVFIAFGSQANFHDNLTVINCHKVGNARTEEDIYSFSRPTRIGGPVAITSSGLLNVYGGIYKNNSVNEEDSSTEEGRNSTLGGVFYNSSNLRIYGGLFEANQGARGGIVYNYLGMKILGGKFTNNYATVTGGVYYSPNSSSSHLLIGSGNGDNEQVVFSDNTAKTSAGVIFSSILNGVVVYGNTVFENNKAISGNGGAINVVGMLTAKNAIFRNNTAGGYGGAVYVSNSSQKYVTRIVNIADCMFESNSADCGGALAVYSSSDSYPNGGIATVSGSTFVTNSAKTVGGAAYVARKSKLTVNASDFIENTSGGEAGALYLVGASDAKITDSSFTSNTAGSHGGTMSVRSTRLDMDNSTIENSTAGSNGGAIYIAYLSSYDVNSDVIINNSSLSGNTSKGNGGAIYTTRRAIDNHTHILTVKNTDFTSNTAKTYGGAVLTTAKSESYFKDVTFSNNKVTSKSGCGGALALLGTATEIDGAVITRNTSGDLGGGIYMKSGASATMNDISASKNNAADKGGFLYGEDCHYKLYNSNLRSNTANFGGGMYLTTNAGSETYNTTFKDNYARTDNGGAMFIYTGNAVETILNGNTFDGNISENCGGALYVSGESNVKIYNTIAKDNSAQSGGFMYETKAGTVVNMSNLTVSGNSDTNGGPIIWGNTKNAVLNIDKSTYTDLDSTGVLDDQYWKKAIYNLLTVNDISEQAPESDEYVGEEEPEDIEIVTDPTSVQDVFKLGQSSSDSSINATYNKLPRLDNSSNFMSKGTTTFDNINGNTVTVDTFVYPYRGQADNMNVGQGLLIYQALLYKQAYPDEEVYIDVASYRLSVDAAVNINRNSRYFGYMRNLSTTDYDRYGFVKISYLLTTAAKMGIHVTVIGHAEGYPANNTMDDYFNSKLNLPCDPDYVQGDKKVSDYLRFVHSQWTLGSTGKGGTDMMHTKMCAVSHYLDMNGQVHRNAVFSSSSNLDGIRSDIQNGNWKLQTGSIVSDHAELYKVATNYLRLVADYSHQEGIIEIQDIVNTKSTEQIDMILAGNADQIPDNEQLVYIGTENDKVFELYFTPFGGSRLAWSEIYNPYCKYVRELHESEDYILFTWNAAEYSSYAFGRQIEELISDAFHTNKNVKNKIYVVGENFDATKYDDLVVGEDIGYKSFNVRAFGDIHNKDLQVSYVKDGQRHNVTLLNSLNIHGGSMYYQSNFCLVINETTCSDDSVFATIAKYTTTGDINTHVLSDEEQYSEGEADEHAIRYHECIECGYKEVIEEFHKSGDWIFDKEATNEENGICHKSCVICGVTTETMETVGILDTEYKVANTTGAKFSTDTATLIPANMTMSPRTFEATILLPKTVSERGGVIMGNNGKANGTPINFEIYEEGKPKLFYMIGNQRADILFKTDIRSNDPVHIAITTDEENAVLYVNGTALESIKLPFPLPETVDNFVVGGDHRKGNTQYFKGTIYSVNAFSEIRTEEDIIKDMMFVPRMTDGLLYTGYYSSETPITMIGSQTLTGMNFTGSNMYNTDTMFENVPATIETVIHIPYDYSERAGTIFGNYAGSNDSFNLEVYSDGILRLFYLGDGVKSDVRFDTDIRSDYPVHLAVTFEENTANLYLDGELVESKELPNALPVINDYFTIGSDKRGSSGQYFKGTLYALNMYSEAKTADEIKNSTLCTGEYDESVLYSSVITPTEVIEHKSNGQTFDEMTVGYVNCKLPATPRTFEATIQLPETYKSRGGIIIGNNGGDENIINFEIYKNGKPRFYYIANGVTVDCVFNTDVRSDEPVHIAVTMDSFTASLYVNGEYKESIDVDYALGESTANFIVGGDHRLGNGQYFKGKIYSVNLFEDIRTEEEIRRDSYIVMPDEDCLLYSGYYLNEDVTEISSDDIHSERVVSAEYPTTETSDGMECLSCANCGVLVAVNVTPAENRGINHIDHTSIQGLKPGNPYEILTDLGTSPKTVEAVIQLSPNQNSRAGVVFGNYDGTSKDQINFEIYEDGCPRLWFKSAGVASTSQFKTDIRSEGPNHIAFTIDDSKVSLYVNGEFKETVTFSAVYPEVSEGFMVGGDHRSGGTQSFKGTVYSINVFNDIRTADELKIDLIGVASNAEGLVYSKYFQ